MMIRFYILLLIIISTDKGLAQHSPAAGSIRKELLVLDSVRLSYTEAGKGAETILFIHGLGGNRRHWQRTLPAMAEGFRSLAVDLPGYGDSKLQQVPQDSLLHFFSKSLVALMDSLKLENAHIVGHSMGAQIAMLFALEYPERVQKLVLAAPAGIETFTEAEAQSLKAYARQAYPQKGSEKQIRENYALNFYQMPGEAEALLQERLQLNESVYFPTYAQVLIKAVEGMLETPVYNRLAALKPPVLMVFGAEDKLIPNPFMHPELNIQEIAQKAKEAIPKSQLVMLPQAGHLLMFEQPEAFNRLLIQFLQNTNAN